LPALRRAFNHAKTEVAPWWAECSKEAFNTGLDGLARALRNFCQSRSGNRAGRRVGFPRFRSRRRATPSVRFTTGIIRVETDRTHITLPRLGAIKTHESTRKLARRIEAGTARILSATVRLEAGRWFCSFTVQVHRVGRAAAQPQAAAGVDVGITHLAVLSTGETVPNPRHLQRALRELRFAARTLSRRTGPDRRTGQRASARWERAKADLGRRHARVANLRRDGLHKLTTRLSGQYGTIVVEDLNVAGMLANHRLARHICDAGFSEIRRQLAYKTTWNGGKLIIADRWYPSSKTCSGCGAAKAKLPLRVRTFTCEYCGLNLDRDLNAARNLAQLVTSTTGTGVAGDPTPNGVNGRGADQKTTLVMAGGCEASTPHRITGQDGDRSLVTASCG
jgi:putative transposase